MLAKDQICKSTTEFLEAQAVTFLNPYSILKISSSTVDLKTFDKICIDGIALKKFVEFAIGDIEIERLSFDFTSIAHDVFKKAVTENQKGFILGSDADSSDTFILKITEMFPGITLTGRSGYFDNDDELDNYVSLLAASEHDFIVIGMGAVKQEQIAISLMESGYKGKLYTCGGFIHQTAMGDGEYYPKWVDKFNLRFAYRMYKEPTTITRYLFDYPKAFFLLTRNIKSFKN